jgi:hypothetical protein
MGVSQSKNVASAVQNVSNYVDNTTSANSDQVAQLEQTITNDNCLISLSEDYNIKTSANLSIKNEQILKALQNADIKNDLQQSVLQEAVSKVGSLGIGYASASNSASMLVNSSNVITNAMKAASSQYSDTSQNFSCENSTIIARNLNIDFSNTADFLSSQVLDNSQVATVVNNISQKLTQKASATVEGLAGFLLALAVVIIAVGYTLTKPLTTGGGKIIIVVILLVVILLILSFMFIRKTPPFFNENNDCSPFSIFGGCEDECINVKKGVKKIDNSPLRYIYGLKYGDTSLSDANLVQIVISFTNKASRSNAGYNMYRLEELKGKVEGIYKQLENNGIRIDGPEKIPSLLKEVNSGKNYNIPQEYLKSGDDTSRTSFCTPSFLQYVDFKDNGTESIWLSCPQDGVMSKASESKSESPDKEKLLAILNKDDWTTWLNSVNSDSRAKHARYVLCDLLEGLIELNVYIDDDELVKYKDENGITKIRYANDPESSKYCYKFNSFAPYTFKNGLSNGGTLTGPYGVCNNNTYKYHTFMTKIGSWIMLVLLLVFFCFLFFQWKTNKKLPK